MMIMYDDDDDDDDDDDICRRASAPTITVRTPTGKLPNKPSLHRETERAIAQQMQELWCVVLASETTSLGFVSLDLVALMEALPDCFWI